MTDWAAILPVVGAFAGAASVLAYIRWTWRPRIVYGDGDRGYVHRDSTGRPQIEADLLADTIERLPIGVFVTTEDYRCVYLNPAAEAAVGWTRSELQKHGDYRTLIDSHDLKRAEETVRKNTARNLMILGHENRWVARDGTRRHLVWSASTFDRRGYSRCTVQLLAIEPHDPDDA